MINFFADQWKDKLGLSLAFDELPQLARALSEASVLASQPCPLVPGKLVRDTHFVFLGLSEANKQPLTLLKWNELCSAADLPLISEVTKVHFRQERFASEALAKTCLYLVPAMYPFEELVFERQLAQMPGGYEVDNVVEAAQSQLLHRITAGSFFGGSSYGRTASFDSHGSRVMVGYGESDGLHLAVDSEDRPGVGVGLAIHRKIYTPDLLERAA